MKPVCLKELKKGEYFTLKAIEEPTPSQVFVRDEYDRSSKKIDVHRYSDVNDFKLLSGKKIVYIDFYF